MSAGIAVMLAACGSSSSDSPSQDAGTCTGSGVSKRPWVLHFDETSALLRWEACRDGTSSAVTVTPEKGGDALGYTATSTEFTIENTYVAALSPDAPPDAAGTYYMHEATLDGLSPGTCYSYTLGADAAMTGRFCTAHAAGEPYTFIAIADTNPGLGDHMTKVAAAVDPIDYDFTLHGGDIQYYASGLETWQSWFPLMAPILAHGAFQPSVGNHESEQPNEYEDYYARFFGGAGFDGTDAYYRFEDGGVWFFALDTEEALDPGSPQFGWFSSELADAASQPGYRFSIVFFHRPFLTCGDMSQNDSARGLLQPLFEQYDVPIVLQGHMHGYERFEVPMDSDPSKTITYMTVAGGGGAIGNVDENIDRPTCSMRVSSGPFRFACVFKVGAAGIDEQTIDEDGAVRDSFSKALP
jgi:hypothetical protein